MIISAHTMNCDVDRFLDEVGRHVPLRVRSFEDSNSMTNEFRSFVHEKDHNTANTYVFLRCHDRNNNDR